MSATLTAPTPTGVRHPLAYIRENLLALERDESHLVRWATRHPCLQGVESTGELVRRTHQSLRGSSPVDLGIEDSERILRAVVAEHLAGDPHATMTCLLLLYPLLASCVHHLEDDLASDLVAATLAALPRVPEAPRAFMLIKRAVHTELRTRTTRRPLLERTTSPYGLTDIITDAETAPLGAERQREDDRARGEVWELLLDARSAGIITADEAQLLIEVHGLDPQHTQHGYAAVSARRHLSESAVRQRCSRAMRRMRQGIQRGDLAR